MNLKARLFIFMSILFLFFTAIVWLYSQSILQQINNEWATRFIQKQVIFDKSRTLLPILKELSLVKAMAQDPSVITMALNVKDKQARENGLAAIERHKLKFQDRSYFAAFSQTNEYFFNNSTNDYDGKQVRYILSKDNPANSWFFFALSQNDEFQININKDLELGTTKVWINYMLEVNNKKLAVLGTGFDFEEFLKNSVGIEQEGVRNFFINKNLDVQLARDTKLIDYSSITKSDGQHKKIDLFITKPNDIERLKSILQELEEKPLEIRTFWVDFKGKKQLLGVANLQEIGWFSLTLINSGELSVVHQSSIVPILSVLFLIALFFLGLTLNQFILIPINKLKAMMKRVEAGDYNIEPTIVGQAEIAELSEQFKKMVTYVQKNSKELENTIKDRTLNLVKSEAKLNTVLDSVEAYIYIKDTNYRYIYVNKKTCEYFNKTVDEVINKTDDVFFNADTVKDIRAFDEKVLSTKTKISHEEINTDINNNMTFTFLSTKIPLFDENGEVYALCGISTDITERKKTEELIKKLAFYDVLTKLPNRRMLEDRLNLMLAQTKRSSKIGALMVIDLDNFKPINDQYGHKAGDDLLIEVAIRLKNAIREVDIVARFGGDEFIVALGELDEFEKNAKEKALEIAKKILIRLATQYNIIVSKEDNSYEQITHFCTASIGLTLFDKNDINQDKIFQRADKAMYYIKQSGKNSIKII